MTKVKYIRFITPIGYPRRFFDFRDKEVKINPQWVEIDQTIIIPWSNVAEIILEQATDNKGDTTPPPNPSSGETPPPPKRGRGRPTRTKSEGSNPLA